LHGIDNGIPNGILGTIGEATKSRRKTAKGESSMTTTLTVDKAGRVVIPKRIREKMHLQPGTRLRLELVGDRLELTHEPSEVYLERRGKRRVIVGWEGFDAVQAVQDARHEHLDRLAGERREG
jgi:AbrB family looped-hinge helix DNA binding protein